MGIPETVLEENFMKGLEPDIRVVLRILRSRGLSKTVELAHLIKDKNVVEKGHKRYGVNNPP